MVPLSVILSGPFGTAYPVLKETLAFHLPRIKQIIQHRTFGTDNVEDLLESLGSRDTFLMEWLEMRASVDEAQLKLPDRVITESVSLQDISLEGLGLNWELAPAFTSLKRLDITIPLQFAPSLAQLLRFLSRIPLLETLIIDEIDPNQEPPYIAERVSLKYLNWISLSCKNLSIITAFLDHVSFPREKTTLRLRSALSPALHTLDESSATALQKLVKTIDNASDGSASSLAISDGIRFWKSKERTWLRPTLELEIETSLGNISGLNATILRSLRLDQLLSLEVSDPNDIRVWTLIGSLPHLEELLACEGNELALIETLRRASERKETCIIWKNLSIELTGKLVVSPRILTTRTIETILPPSLTRILMTMTTAFLEHLTFPKDNTTLCLSSALPRILHVHPLEEFADEVHWGGYHHYHETEESRSVIPDFDDEDEDDD
ncbi:hypothetical protein H0H92_008128 [Tricholoma furcatifolium]|nr:hypothetical protein H0H92_008128 [Tricholoma furcatifolium]